MVTKFELRIGNWVQNDINYHWQIESYGELYDIFENEDIDKEKKLVPLPIPITPEVLLFCGFEKSESNDTYQRTIYGIQVANNTSLYFDAHKDWMRGDKEVEWYLSHEWNNNHFKNDFWGCPKYLHQLQNLYFTLTGTELNYQPK